MTTIFQADTLEEFLENRSASANSIAHLLPGERPQPIRSDEGTQANLFEVEGVRNYFLKHH